MLEMCYRRRGDGAERGSVVRTRGEKEEVKCDNEVIMRRWCRWRRRGRSGETSGSSST